MNNDTGIRRLPQGIQSFEKIRTEGYVYIDKTDLVWRIANDKQNNFLSRPRRFGKSLLVDTLQCYFEGKRELFQGLKIMQLEQSWTPRQVFRFDFGGFNTRADLEKGLNFQLAQYEKIYPRDQEALTLGDRMFSLMQKACERTGQQVAVLVDEYDSPLQHTVFDEQEHKGVVQVYRSFFPSFKTGDKYLKCLFLTGITKFTQLSLFSTLNNVSILSAWREYATVCGITQQEIIDNFMPWLQRLGEKQGWTVETTLQQLREMYDGYHFSADLEQGVYNPYSLISALDDSSLSAYWFQSGGSTLLNELLRRADVEQEQLDGCTIDKDTLDMADVSLDNIPLFLYQCGYLTIKKATPRRYTLGIPNREVRKALYGIVLPNAIGRQPRYVDNVVGKIQEALDTKDITEAMEQMRELIAGVPFAHNSNEYLSEERFRYLLKLAFYIVGCRVEEERQVATGIIDLVAHYDTCILVMELKLDSNGGLEAAKQQLADRSYVAAYAAEGKDIYAVAISFSTQTRGISAYDIQKM